MSKIEELNTVVDGLRNGLFENYTDLDEAVLPYFEWLLEKLDLATTALDKIASHGLYPAGIAQIALDEIKV